jgi:hypothetical protein
VRSKHWKEVAIAKQHKRKSKSMAELTGNLDAEHDNSLDKDNYLLKDTAKNVHASDFVLKDIPIAVNSRAKSVSPVSRRKMPSDRSTSPRLAECRNWNAVEDNSSDDYSVVSYSKIKSIQTHSSHNDLHFTHKSKNPGKESNGRADDSWCRRQIPKSDYARPLPPPPDFSDSDDGNGYRAITSQHSTSQNVPSKPPRRSRSPAYKVTAQCHCALWC